MTIEIISKEDYKAIAEIAKKYNMKVEDFGRLIGRRNKKQLHCQVKFSADELSEVDREASKKGVTRSKYCRLCYKTAIEKELYKDINILKTVRSEIKRDLVVNISFDDAEEYKEMRKLAKKFSVPFSNLLRYFSLTVKL